MENISTHSSKAASCNLSTTTKKPRFVKNRFADLKIKISKKKENASEASEKASNLNDEKTKKLSLDKAKAMIDKDLDNDHLLIKIIDKYNFERYLQDIMSKEGDFDLQKDENPEVEFGTGNESNYSETSQEFFKKFRKFNDHERKGLLKQLKPSNGFIKASQEVMIVPNPIAFVNKDGGMQRTINLKYIKAFLIIFLPCFFVLLFSNLGF